MTKWAWAAVTFMMASGLFMIFKFGMSPRPIKMIKTSYSDTSSEVGSWVFKRLRNRLQGESHIVFGVQQEHDSHFDLVKGFLNTAKSEGLDFESRVKEARLDSDSWQETENWPKFDFNGDVNELVSMFLNPTRKAFLLPTVYASHTIGGNPLARLEEKIQKKIMTVSVVHMVLNRQRLTEISPGCSGDAVMGAPTREALGCLARRKSHSFFRKEMDESRFVFLMEQNGRKDYLVYLHTPKN